MMYIICKRHLLVAWRGKLPSSWAVNQGSVEGKLLREILTIARGVVTTKNACFWENKSAVLMLRKQTLRFLSLSYPKKDWRSGAPPILLWVWHQLQNIIYEGSRVIFYSGCHSQRRIGGPPVHPWVWQRQRHQGLFSRDVCHIHEWCHAKTGVKVQYHTVPVRLFVGGDQICLDRLMGGSFFTGL